MCTHKNAWSYVGASGSCDGVATTSCAPGQYNQIGSITNGYKYKVEANAGDYVTIRKGSSTGPVYGELNVCCSFTLLRDFIMT